MDHSSIPALHNGILGNGEPTDQATPTKVTDVAMAVDLDVRDHACAVLADGTLACWGADVFLPDVTASDQPIPVPVDGISGVVNIAVGFWYTCALTQHQELYCWGSNGSHELGLGDGSPLWVYTPTRVDWHAALTAER